MQTTQIQGVTGWRLENTYSALDGRLFSLLPPVPVASPSVALFNGRLATELGLDFSGLQEEGMAALFAGNALPEGATPLAQAYAGHQFGHFTMLGDGRAILLGEQVTPKGTRFDIQLKGSGRTPYSRNGDGRATFGAMLREYLVSEAMHHLGIPTTRSLAVALTGEPVYRERPSHGAVLTRVAASHLRVGTFEFARQFLDTEALQSLVHYALQRHYPDRVGEDNPALALLEEVAARQTNLVVQWLRVGFIHGVMNTDNMSIAGETIDYGPCAFMNVYDPGTVFSSIDQQGRYAFGNQPFITQWNLACLASALLPLLHTDEDKGVEMVREVLNGFAPRYRQKWLEMMRAKMGLAEPHPDDQALADDLLAWMQQHEADYTNTFLALAANETTTDPSFAEWHSRWAARVAQNPGGLAQASQIMQAHNPIYIPRNHQLEAALEAAAQHGDMAPLHQLLEVVSAPYTPRPGLETFQQPPTGGDEGYRTFCGT